MIKPAHNKADAIGEYNSYWTTTKFDTDFDDLAFAVYLSDVEFLYGNMSIKSRLFNKV